MNVFDEHKLTAAGAAQCGEMLKEAEARAAALEADRDQISLTLDVAKADRDKWFNRARDLEKVLLSARSRSPHVVLPSEMAACFPAETACKYHLYRMIDEPCTCSTSDRGAAK